MVCEDSSFIGTPNNSHLKPPPEDTDDIEFILNEVDVTDAPEDSIYFITDEEEIEEIEELSDNSYEDNDYYFSEDEDDDEDDVDDDELIVDAYEIYGDSDVSGGLEGPLGGDSSESEVFSSEEDDAPPAPPGGDMADAKPFGDAVQNVNNESESDKDATSADGSSNG